LREGSKKGAPGFFWRHFRRSLRRFRPSTPFAADNVHKGNLTPIARAQKHVWQNYQVAFPKPIELKHPLRLVVLSDLHVGSHHADLERLANIVNEISKRKLDILILPGDFVNMQIFGGGRVRPESVAKVLAPLTQRIPTFAVLGNHDSQYGLEHVESSLTAVGVTVLRNSWSRCSTSAGDIFIVGLEDESTGSPNFTGASIGIPKNAPLLVIAHDPASFSQIPDQPLIVISGHTHGGQVRLPWVGAVVNASAAPLAWSHGYIRLGLRHLIVSAGIGTSVVPIRFRCPPEINEIELSSLP
jgi:uncharacterized protein